jgi:putative ABC transport system permease protein
MLQENFRYALRQLRHSAVVSAAAMVTLALGVGVNAGVFTVVYSVLLRQLPYPHAERLVVLGERSPDATFSGTAPGNFLDYQRRLRSVDGLAAFVSRTLTLTERGMPLQLDGQVVSPNFFKVLGVAAEHGRTLDPSIEVALGPRAAVLGHDAWVRVFGADRGVIGKVVRLDGENVGIVGVMPEQFMAPRPAEIWMSPRFQAPEPTSGAKADEMEDRGNYNFLRPVARLRPGVSLEQADAELRSVSRQLEREYPYQNEGKVMWARPLHDWLVGDVRMPLLTIQMVAGFILALCCINVANLLTARGISRRREMAIRASLGAARRQLVWQLLIESAILGAGGGLAGLLLAVGCVRLLAIVKPAGLPRLGEIDIDWPLALFTLGLSLAAALVAGSVPAWRASAAHLATALKDGGRAGSGGGRRERHVLIIVEVTLAFALLVVSTLLVRSYSSLLDVKLGFEADRVVVTELSLPVARYDTDARVTDFFDRLIDRVRALPGVAGAGLVNALPFGRGGTKGPVRPEERRLPVGEQFDTQRRAVTPGYFGALQVPLLEGRDFQSTDRTGSQLVAIVNQRLARYAWPGESAIGKRLSWGGPRWMTVVGVVGDLHQHQLDESPTFDTYIPLAQEPSLRTVAIAVRTAGTPSLLARPLREAVAALDKELALRQVTVLRDLVVQSYAQRRLQMLLVVSVGVLALLLTAVGIYGVMAYSVSQRTRDLGIRMALGAGRGRLFRSVILEGFALAGWGILAGLMAASILARVTRSLLFQVSEMDPGSYLFPCILVLAIVLLATYLPARRATAVDPTVSLRES